MLVLLDNFGLLALIHKVVYGIAARLIANSHFNPASFYWFLIVRSEVDSREAIKYSLSNAQEVTGVVNVTK